MTLPASLPSLTRMISCINSSGMKSLINNFLVNYSSFSELFWAKLSSKEFLFSAIQIALYLGRYVEGQLRFKIFMGTIKNFISIGPIFWNKKTQMICKCILSFPKIPVIPLKRSNFYLEGRRNKSIIKINFSSQIYGNEHLIQYSNSNHIGSEKID